MAAIPASASSTVDVQMKDFTFIAPGGGNSVTINAGETVRWVWAESVTDPTPNCDTFSPAPPTVAACPGHTATAADKDAAGKPLFDTGTCAPPDGKPVCPYSVTFTKPGTYHYYCIYHGGRAYGNTPNQPVTNMDGVVIVKAVAGANSSAPAPGTAAPAEPGLPGAGAAAASPEASWRTTLGTLLLAVLAVFGLGRARSAIQGRTPRSR